MTATAGDRARMTDERGGSDDLCLREVAQMYAVSVATLRRQVRTGDIPAHKVRGPWGHEWRVSRRAVDAAGLAVRSVPPVDAAVEDPDVASLRREVAALRRTAASERNRADQADRELGWAMLESGRLRSASTRARAEHARCRDCPWDTGATSTSAGTGARAARASSGQPDRSWSTASGA